MTDILTRAKAALEGITEEPWAIDLDAFDEEAHIIKKTDMLCLIAVVDIAHMGDEGKANAHFIAAAPELVRDLMAEVERLREALERLAKLGNGDRYGNSEGNMIARAALEGDKP